MLGLEPKDLPVGTTISFESEGLYFKDRMWDVEVWLQENSNSLEVIFDEPTPELIEKVKVSGYTHIEESSQEFFGMDWSIVSVPWHFAVMLAREIQVFENRDWTYVDCVSVDDILKSSILDYTKAEEEA